MEILPTVPIVWHCKAIRCFATRAYKFCILTWSIGGLIFGAGILVEIPDKFFRRNLSEKIELPKELPAAGNYAVGVFFFSQDKKKSKQQKLLIEKAIKKSPLDFLCWREVPTNNQCLSPNDLGREPCIFHLFVTTKNSSILAKEVYLLRKKIAKTPLFQEDSFFDCISFSSFPL